MASAAENVEPTAEQQAFPGFEGRSVRGASFTLNGTVRVDDSVEVVGNDDEVTITLKGKVVSVNHKRIAKTGLVRIQSVEVSSVESVTVTKRGDKVVSISDRHRQTDIDEDGNEVAPE